MASTSTRLRLVGAAVGAGVVAGLLALLLGAALPLRGAWALGLVAGLVVDLLGALLVLVLVAHRRTMGKLRQQRRVLRTVEARATRVEEALDPETARTSVLSTLASAQGVETVARALGDRVQATVNLFSLVRPQGPVPPLVGYVASPDVLLLLVQKFLEVRPAVTLECGSGTSTLFLALAAQQHGVPGRIVALESSPEHVEGTRALLDAHGVGHLAEVRHAPLVPSGLPDHDGLWYDQAAIADLDDIGLAFVDGPPGTLGRHARYPAVPLLLDRLAPRSVVLLDDAARSAERAVAERWLPRLAGFRLTTLPLTRGAALFERDAA